MTRKRGLAELIEEVTALKAPNAMKKRLQELVETNPMLLQILIYAYHKDVAWHKDIPKGTPPYEANDKSTDLQGQLYSEWKRMHRFLINDKYAGLNKLRRQQLFIGLLEVLDPDDAKLIIGLKDGKIKGISEELVRKSFPDLLPKEENKGKENIDETNQQN